MMQLVASALAVFSVFLFPYPFTILLTLIASSLFPPVGLLIGVLIDALYYPGMGYPLGILMGIGASAFGLFVHRFAKARIMNA